MRRALSIPSLFLMMSAAWAQTTPAPTLAISPAALSFTYQTGSALPAAQTVAIKRAGSGTALDYTITVSPGANWLIVTPLSGKTGGSASVLVNPTSLLAGTYTASFQIDATGVTTPAVVQVSLLVRNPPPSMAISPSALTYSFDTDGSAPPAQAISILTSGEPVSFSALATSPGNWLSIDKTSAIAVSGSPVTITATAVATGMAPGIYSGKIAITSTNASNKSVTVNVQLTVAPGTAVIDSVWPNAVPVGSDDATITIRGRHLFKATAVTAGATPLTTTVIGNTVLLAVVPKSLLASQGALQVTATNAPRPASNAATFTVTAPGPQIQMAVNSASFYNAGSTPVISPGEIVSIFGSGMGPAQTAVAAPSGGAYPATLGTPATIVEFELTPGNWTPAPIIFAQSNQVNAVSPFALTPAAARRLRVTYNGIVSSPFTFDAVAANPGLYTVDSSGAGQAAALNYNTQTAAYSINADANAAPKGSIVILYLTGGGVLDPNPSQEGQVISTTQAAPALAGQVSVTIGGEGASLQSATAVPGAIAGLVQLNVTVPSTARADKKVPVVVTIGGRSSSALTTIAIK